MNAHDFVKAVAFPAACLLFVLAVSGTSTAADIKLGKINYEVVQKNSKRINAGIMEIQKVQQESQTKINALRRDLTALEARLNQEKEPLTPEEKHKIENESNEKKQEMESERQALKVKLAFKQQSLANTISPLVQQIIARIAKEEGIAAVFRSDSVAYADGIVDITDKVVKALDEAPSPDEPQAK